MLKKMKLLSVVALGATCALGSVTPVQAWTHDDCFGAYTLCVGLIENRDPYNMHPKPCLPFLGRTDIKNEYHNKAFEAGTAHTTGFAACQAAGGVNPLEGDRTPKGEKGYCEAGKKVCDDNARK